MGTVKAKKVKKFNPKSLIVTIDIGKDTHWGYFRAPDGTEIKPFAFYTTRTSFNKFYNKMQQFANSQGAEEIIVGFESTGPYAEPLFHYLMDKPVKLVQVNPMHTKRIKELTGNSPNKTDRKDPRVIADVISLGHVLTLVIPQKNAAQLRRMSHARQRLIKKCTTASNQLNALVYSLFPEFCGFFKDITCKSALYVLRHHPIPSDIAAQDRQALAKVLKKISRGRIGSKRTRALIDAACRSVGIREGQEALAMEMGLLIEEINRHRHCIEQLEDQMQDALNEIPYSRSIVSIKGLGVATVAGLIGEVGDFRQFKTIAEITKLAGLDLYEISSGKQTKGRRRISKRGRPLMRKLLFFAAINTIRRGGIMHDTYHQMLKRGMVRIKAVTAISRKLLALIFALVRDNAVYVDHYHHNHEIKRAA
jgi:transposase